MLLTLDINENKFEAFLNFVKTLYFIAIKVQTNDDTISQWAQDIAAARKNDAEDFVDEEAFFNELDKGIL